MPIPKPLSDLKKDVEEFISASEPQNALQYLQDLLPEDSGKRTQAILIQGKLSNASQKHRTGQIRFEDHQIELSQVSAAILDLASGLSESDFESKNNAAGRAPVAAVPKFVVIYDPADKPHCDMLNKHLNVLKFLKKIQVSFRQ